MLLWNTQILADLQVVHKARVVDRWRSIPVATFSEVAPNHLQQRDFSRMSLLSEVKIILFLKKIERKKALQ